MQIIQASDQDLSDCRFAIVVSRYNSMITDKIRDAAIETMTKNGVSESHFEVISVPGAWEIPLAAKWLLERKKLDGVVCLGCVIKGETSHDQHINREVSQALCQLSQQYQVPVSMGVLTCNNLKQAEARSGGDRGNKGVEATEAVIEMVRLNKLFVSE